MQFWRVRFPLWRLMAVVASVACFAAALVTFSDTRNSGERVLFAWVTLYGAPLILIVARGVPLGRAAKIAGTIILCGLPVVGFFAFFNLLMGPLVGLMIVWIALMAVALLYRTLGKLVDKMYAPPPIAVGEPELPPLVYDPKWVQPNKTRAEGFWDSHWIGFLFLLPALVMVVVREILGMTDALLMPETPWDRASADFNLATDIVGFLGSTAFVLYALVLPIVTRRGWRWVLPKLAFLVLYWLVILLGMSWIRLLHA